MRLLLIACLLLFASCVQQKSYFKAVRDDSGVWWFRDQGGNTLFLNGVTTIQPYQKSRNGISYLSKDYNGDVDQWAKATAARVVDYGFSSSGAWSHPSIANHLPYAKDLNLMLHVTVPISHDDWPKQIDEAVKSQVKDLVKDRNLIGYYTDNELNWDEIEDYADRYFSITSESIRRHDPNHLILGVRFNNRPAHSVLSAMRGRVDVVSFNQYPDQPTLWRHMINEAHLITGLPIIISEFSNFAEENASGCPNEYVPSGAKPFGGLVKTQKDRAERYGTFVLRAASCPFVVGMDWFQWSDEPPEGRGDGEAYNFGAVDIYDRPYLELQDAVRETRRAVNAIHAHSQTDPQLWAEDPHRPIRGD